MVEVSSCQSLSLSRQSVRLLDVSWHESQMAQQIRHMISVDDVRYHAPVKCMRSLYLGDRCCRRGLLPQAAQSGHHDSTRLSLGVITLHAEISAT